MTINTDKAKTVTEAINTRITTRGFPEQTSAC